MEEKNLNEVVNEETKAEVVEAEVVEEKETVEADVVEESVQEEPEYIEHEMNVTIEEETYVEYFKEVGFKAQIKTTVVMGIVIALLSYFFRPEGQAATDALLGGLLWGAGFVIVWLGFQFFTTAGRARKTYQRSQIQGLIFKTTLSNKGIRQSIEDQSVLYDWSAIQYVIESDTSFFCHMPAQRRIVLMSKKTMSAEDIEKTHNILVEKLGPTKVKPLKK